MTVDEWLQSVRNYLGREMTAAETIKAKTHYRENPLLARNYMKPPKNQASGTFLIDITDKDDTDVPEKEMREGN